MISNWSQALRNTFLSKMSSLSLDFFDSTHVSLPYVTIALYVIIFAEISLISTKASTTGVYCIKLELTLDFKLETDLAMRPLTKRLTFWMFHFELVSEEDCNMASETLNAWLSPKVSSFSLM